MKYVMAASPLTKIFLEQKLLKNEETQENESWQERCMRDFKIIEDVELPFEFSIVGGDGARNFAYNVPQMLVATPNSTIEAQFEHIAGGADGQGSHEYDIYGIVPYDIGHDIVQKMHEMAMLMAQGSDKAQIKAKVEKITRDVEKSTKIARDKAIRMATAKLERAIKRNHRYLDMQWRSNAERGGSKYAPSVTERLGAISIRDLIMRQQNQERSAMAEFAKIMDQTSRDKLG